MTKIHKWDAYVSWDDDEKKKAQREEDIESMEEQALIEKTAPVNIDDISSATNEESDLSSLIDMVNSVNQKHESYFENIRKQEEEEALLKQKEEEEKHQREKEEAAKLQYEKEMAQKEKFEFEQEQKRAAEAAEAAKKRENNIVNKIFGVIKPKPIVKPPKAKKDEKDTDPVQKEVAEPSETVEQAEATAETEPVASETEETKVQVAESENNEPECNDAVEIATTKAYQGEVIKGVEQKVNRRRPKKSPDKDMDKDVEKCESDVPESASDEPKVEEKHEPVDEHVCANNDENSKPVAAQAPEKKEIPKKKGFFSIGLKSEKKSKPVESESEIEPASETDYKYLAEHDADTGLLNKRAFNNLKADDSFKKGFAVVFVDINNLKYINDTINHEAGNKAISATAERVKSFFDGDKYRIGGDEFVVVIRNISPKKITQTLTKQTEKFHKELEELTKQEKESKIVYSASIGFAVSEGRDKKDLEETIKEAESNMYVQKKLYKKSNPQYDLRNNSKSEKKNTKNKINDIQQPDMETPTRPEDYDKLLTETQRNEIEKVKSSHTRAPQSTTKNIVRVVQQRQNEIIAILIASPDFDKLFIIQDIQIFLGLVEKSQSLIDYSFLAIVYKTGVDYQGTDEYTKVIKEVFDAIGLGLKSNRLKTTSDIKKIKGIELFKHIYIH